MAYTIGHIVIIAVCVTSGACASNDIVKLNSELKFKAHDSRSHQLPFRNLSLPIDERLDDLLGRLTVTELINQTVARYGSSHFTPGIGRLGIKPIQYITECLRGVRKENATAFPQSLGLAASFSRDLMHRVSEAVGIEVRAFYNDDQQKGVFGSHGLTCFSPVINILRHPLWGRNQVKPTGNDIDSGKETYGEDPLLSGSLGAEYVRGIQGDDSNYLRVAAGCKHFDAHGGPDTIPIRKFHFDAKIKERDLQMTFLPAFKQCVAAKPYNVMCSFNSINGVPACANKRFLTDILRKEWKYDGFVISDDAAVEYIHTEHHYNASFKRAAVEAVRSGCNVALVGKFDPAFWTLNQAINDGLITKKELIENARPVFLTRFLLGEFDPPSRNPFSKITKDVVLSQVHRELALEAALKSFVLLKNDDDLLPLQDSQNKHISIVGPMSNYTDGLMGDYATDTDPSLISTPLDGLRRLSSNVHYSSGCSLPTCDDYNPGDVQSAVKGSELVFVALGTGAIIEAENNDRYNIDLPGSQLQILKDVIYYCQGCKVILLLFNAGPLDITFAKLKPEVKVIVECFFPAMTAGDAIFKMLTNSDGKSVPAGRLPVTWPANLNQVRNITDYTMEGRTYRYYTEDPLYPFGFGLSYTKFQYSNLSVTPSEIKKGEGITVEVTVGNTGQQDADEVVQVYISWPQSSIQRPRWQLIAFDRVNIKKGAKSNLKFSIEASQLEIWHDEKLGFDIIPGEMTVYAGGQQPKQRDSVGSNVLSAKLTMKDK